jgi:hypothetical protein
LENQIIKKCLGASKPKGLNGNLKKTILELFKSGPLNKNYIFVCESKTFFFLQPSYDITSIKIYYIVLSFIEYQINTSSNIFCTIVYSGEKTISNFESKAIMKNIFT